jgi:transcriptional regulator GlxA family with amidase domain
MSPRNFARVFSREMRVTPAKFVERLRVETARRRLEETDRGLKEIAHECGFGSAAAMRGVFQRQVGTAPGQYRQHFRTSVSRREEALPAARISRIRDPSAPPR